MSQIGESTELAYLLFIAGGEIYGTKITDVREVIAPIAPKPISDTSNWVKGIINLRGEVLVVIDLRERLKTAVPVSKGFMVIDTERGPMALIVDEIKSVRTFKPEEIQERTHLQVEVKNEYFIGIGQKSNETAILLDLKRIFTDEILVNSSESKRATDEP